jgi:hypothetical protein
MNCCLARLKADIAHGLADVANGRVADFDSERIIARGNFVLSCGGHGRLTSADLASSFCFWRWV